MSLTTVPTASRAAEPGELVCYPLPDGERVLVGQRLRGRVAVIDVPADPDGHIYVVERSVSSQVEFVHAIACAGAAGTRFLPPHEKHAVADEPGRPRNAAMSSAWSAGLHIRASTGGRRGSTTAAHADATNDQRT